MCIEERFRTLKGGPWTAPCLPPVRRADRSHILISFLAYGLHVTLEQYNKKAATGLSSRGVLERMGEIQMLDVNIPATDGRELRMKRSRSLRKSTTCCSTNSGSPFPGTPSPEIRKPKPVVETF